jgi:hypothetical protein
MPVHQRGKSGLLTVAGKPLQELAVGQLTVDMGSADTSDKR